MFRLNFEPSSDCRHRECCYTLSLLRGDYGKIICQSIAHIWLLDRVERISGSSPLIKRWTDRSVNVRKKNK